MSKEVKRYTLYPQLKPEALAFLPDVVVDAKAYDALLAERDALKKDAERLEFMLREQCVVDSQNGSASPVVYRVSWPRDGWQQTHWYPSEREAIDAAMQGEQP